MSETPSSRAANGVVLPFPSLAALRTAHIDLLKRYRESAGSPATLAEAVDFISRGSATGVLLDSDDDRAAGQSLLDYWSTLLYREGHEPPDATLAEFDPELAPELDDVLCPYLGLEAFRETNSMIFFGRARLVDFLIGRLEERRLLALVGPSGSGKSSVVRAGVIPALKAGALPGSQDWRYFAPIVPGHDPLAILARLVMPREIATENTEGHGKEQLSSSMPAVVKPTVAETAESLRQDSQYLVKLIDATGETPALLVIDQFEEVFTLAEDDSARRAFIDNLISLIEAPGARHTVILTMRSDFESFVARAPALQAWFEQARVQLMPLNASELREAIEKPAELVGLKFEAGVVDALLQDMLGEPAALPLLQFTLLKLWENRNRNRVTWEAYQRIGGGRLALARSADEFYNNLIPEDQVTAKRILLRIVRPGEGLEVTSNRVRREMLYRAGEASDRIDRVLEKLIAARLVRLTQGETTDDTQIEIAHEALVRNWPTLVDWLEDERAAMAVRRRLEAKAAEWVRLGRGAGGLLDSEQLREARHWLASAEAEYLGYDEALPALVEASRAAIEAAEQEKEAGRQRELDQARALAQEQRRAAEAERARATEQARANKRLRFLAIVLAIMSLLAVTGFSFAVQRGALALAEAGRANSEADRANLEANRANQAAATANAASVAAQQSAQQAQNERATAVAAKQDADNQRQEAVRSGHRARAGQLAAQAQQAASVGQPQLSLLLAVEALNVTQQAGEPPADVATAVLSQTLGNPLSGRGGVGLSGHADAVTAVVISPDGKWLVTGSADTTARLWNLTAADPAASSIELVGHAKPITALAISPDSKLLATGSEDATVRIWDLTAAPAAAPRVLDRPGASGSIGPIRALAISPAGRWVLAGGDDGVARVWDLTRRDPISPNYLSGRPGGITAVAFSPNDRWFATGGADQRVDLWAFSEASGPAGGAPIPLRGHTGAITALLFSDDSHWVVSGGRDYTIRLWDLTTPTSAAAVPIVLTGHTGPLTALATGGRWLLSASDDRTTRLWDLEECNPSEHARILSGHDGAITSVAINGSSGRFATGSADKTARAWDINTLSQVDSSLPQDPAKLVDLACHTAGRNMTEAEWNRYLPGTDYRKTCGS